MKFKDKFVSEYNTFVLFMKYLYMQYDADVTQFMTDGSLRTVRVIRFLKYLALVFGSVMFYIQQNMAGTLYFLFAAVLLKTLEVYRIGFWKHKMRSEWKKKSASNV